MWGSVCRHRSWEIWWEGQVVMQYVIILYCSSHYFWNSTIMCSEPGKLVIGSHDFPLCQEESHDTRSGTQHHSSSSVCPWLHGRNIVSLGLLLDFSKRFLLVRVTWDYSLTDSPPECWVALAFLPVSPSPTLPFALFVTSRLCWHHNSLPSVPCFFTDDEDTCRKRK